MTSSWDRVCIVGCALLLSASILLSVFSMLPSASAFLEDLHATASSGGIVANEVSGPISIQQLDPHPRPVKYDDRLKPRATASVWIIANCANGSSNETLSIEVDGVNNSTPMRFDWEIGSIHILRAYLSEPYGCNSCEFGSWENRSTDLQRIVNVTGPTVITAQFLDYFEYMTSSALQMAHSFEISFGIKQGEWLVYPYYADIQIACARPGIHSVSTFTPQQSKMDFSWWDFTEWMIDPGSYMFTSSNLTVSFNITGPGSATANFVQNVSIIVHITTNIGPLFVGYDNTPLSPSVVSFTSVQGEMHTLRTISPQIYIGTRYTFIGWKGGPTELNWTVTLPYVREEVYEAEFTPLRYYVKIEKDHSCDGIVSPGSGWYLAESALLIDWTPPSSPPPDTRYLFWAWRGEGPGSYTGRNISTTIVVDGFINQTAFCFTVSSMAHRNFPRTDALTTKTMLIPTSERLMVKSCKNLN